MKTYMEQKIEVQVNAKKLELELYFQKELEERNTIIQKLKWQKRLLILCICILILLVFIKTTTFSI